MTNAISLEGGDCCKKVPVKVCRMETQTVCRQVPYTVCKQVPYTVHCKVPYTVTECVPCTVCKKVKVCVPQEVCVKKPRMEAYTVVTNCESGCDRMGWVKNLFHRRLCCDPCGDSGCCK